VTDGSAFIWLVAGLAFLVGLHLWAKVIFGEPRPKTDIAPRRPWWHWLEWFFVQGILNGNWTRYPDPHELNDEWHGKDT
jgi:hypothetical protein